MHNKIPKRSYSNAITERVPPFKVNRRKVSQTEHPCRFGMNEDAKLADYGCMECFRVVRFH